jgi:hypothetical protein
MYHAQAGETACSTAWLTEPASPTSPFEVAICDFKFGRSCQLASSTQMDSPAMDASSGQLSLWASEPLIVAYLAHVSLCPRIPSR